MQFYNIHKKTFPLKILEAYDEVLEKWNSRLSCHPYKLKYHSPEK